MPSYIVVGGGVLGASAAYHLAKAGAAVTLIDRADKGQATEAAAGIICPWLSQRRNKDWYRLAKAGAKYYPELIAQLEEDGETETGYKKTGALSIHTGEEKLDKMQERALKRREDAPEIGEIKRLSPEETRGMFPLLSSGFSSVYVGGAARVNGKALRDALVNAARKNGAEVIHGNARLLVEGRKVIGVEAGGRTMHADKTIVAAGAWAKELFKPLGATFQVSHQKAQIIHLELPGTDTGGWPVVMPPNDQYLLAFEGGRIIAGATHENTEEFDQRVTAGGLHEVLSKVLPVAQGLADAAIIDVKVGFRPFTPGFLPVIGAWPGFGGILAANGLGASGLTVGPFFGAELARLALGRETELDLSPYGLEQAIEHHSFRSGMKP
ncbi:putative oxidoreductase YurR [Weizmannia acidilactici]|uniref:Oxidoreductase YurR n=1 Tax=Weizmannia acidilactici TaxID=2607726 RepID=A0A5J4JLD5_9BACI|nr:FAD-binding oxidoreductase [Weizmannia acidilactici]GER71495.1 putative oxidoreductase YurR [Weizmannia acidilactici]